MASEHAPTGKRRAVPATPPPIPARVGVPRSGFDAGHREVVAAMKAGSVQATSKGFPLCRYPQTSPPGSAMDFERAYRTYNRRVFAKCLHMVGDPAEAEDLTQEVFLQVFRKLDSFRGESAFSTWLYRVAVNIVLVRRRRKSLNMTSLEEVTDLTEGIPSLYQALGAPDRVLTAAADRLSLECALAQMPEGYRQVFLLHDLEGYAHHEIGRLLGVSVGTSKSQLHKARLWLRDLLRAGKTPSLPRRVRGRPRLVSRGEERVSRQARHVSFAGSCS